MRTCPIALVVMTSAGLSGCPKRDLPPESSYDPELLATAKDLAAEEGDGEAAEGAGEAPAAEQGECDRERGGCPAGYLCWDSWYCKKGFDDQCSAMGDKRCHKLCEADEDCPEKMPLCRERPLFKGPDRGTLEKFCVAED